MRTYERRRPRSAWRDYTTARMKKGVTWKLLEKWLGELEPGETLIWEGWRYRLTPSPGGTDAATEVPESPADS